MTKIIILLFFALFSLASNGQKPILVFDLVNGTIDSIPISAYDTMVVSDYTDHNLGSFNATTALLEQTPPTSNTYPGSNFTYKKQASLDYDLTNYPLRTSVKIFVVENDTLKNNCSGSLISSRHVLTAAHCVSLFNSSTLNQDSLKVFPVFDNGIPNANFNSSDVTKVYFFRDWSFNGEDFAVLELEESIGSITGWLGIGFNNVDSLLAEGIFYKFSYPSTTQLALDSNSYNGDSLYYNYGEIDIVTNTSIGISGTSGIPGESGSSIIKVINDQQYTSHGVLSFSNNLMHSKINNWQFYALKNIIEDDIAIVPSEHLDAFIHVYPNPVNSTIHIKNESGNDLIELLLFDSFGHLVLRIDKNNIDNGVDVSDLLSGVYFLKITTNNSATSHLIVKE